MTSPVIAILGASGLIGQSLVEQLRGESFPVLAVARRFTRAQAAGFGHGRVECPVAAMHKDALAALFATHRVEIVVNCIGVLQDSPRGGTETVHEAFVDRLLHAVAAQERPTLLIHVSIPGRATEDDTSFSRTKRVGERLIASRAVPFVILRPGFVIAPSAYGGSALVRALAALPVRLPPLLGERPFTPVAATDLGRSVAAVSRRWAAGERDWRASWDVMAREPSTVAAVTEGFRARLGGPVSRIPLPFWFMRAGAWLGDGVARLGWVPPVRTTALREMQRGVAGDPAPWIEQTGLEPATLHQAVEALPASVQERWFARLFLLKPIVIALLALFWIASGLVPLVFAFRAATTVFTAHGVPSGLAATVTVLTSLLDIAVGLGIALRRSCRTSLLAGIGLSLVYLGAATLLTPELWLDPVGSLVKTAPVLVLMAVALAILDDR